MSPVIFTFPTNKLGKLLRRPGGKSVAEALHDAAEGVATLVPPCLVAVDEALASIERIFAEINPDQEAATFRRLYDETNTIIGLAATAGLPEFDRAAYSLCDVLDYMLRTRRMDRAVVLVHIRTLHLLRHPEALGSNAALREVLAGLEKVRDKVTGAG